MIGQRPQSSILHALPPARPEHGDCLSCRLQDLLAGTHDDVLLLLGPFRNRERHAFDPGGHLGPDRQSTAVGEHEVVESHSDVVQRREVTAQHGEAAPLLRYALPAVDVPDQASADGNDGAIVDKHGVDQHGLDRLTDPLDDQPPFDDDAKRGALFDGEPD